MNQRVVGHLRIFQAFGFLRPVALGIKLCELNQAGQTLGNIFHFVFPHMQASFRVDIHIELISSYWLICCAKHPFYVSF